MNNENTFCLDPSCFVSPKKLEGILEVLSELKKEVHGELKIYVPTQIYENLKSLSINRFLTLKETIQGWIGFGESNFWFGEREEYSERYITNVRKLFEQYNPIPASKVVGDVEKLGEHSLLRSDVLMILKKKGEMIFEMMAISSERVRGRIISFGQRTISMISKLGVPIIMAPSKFKKRIKERSGIRWLLLISSFLTTTHGVSQFLANYELANLPLTLAEIGGLGILLIADGSKDSSPKRKKRKSSK